MLIFLLDRLNLKFEVCLHGKVIETLKSVALNLKKGLEVKDIDLSHNEIKWLSFMENILYAGPCATYLYIYSFSSLV